MSSRPSSDFNEVRNPPKDRTPPRFTDRRSSASYSAGLSSRINDSSYRANELSPYTGSDRDFPKEPPRGPKAHPDGQRGGGFPQRGRGFSSRIDPRDREVREVRDPSTQKREGDRDWPWRDTFENRDPRPSPTGRNRSRSPAPRDFRDSRDPPPRDLDLTRIKRDSRDAPISAASIPEAPASAPFFGRGVPHGRGPGENEARGRGRGIIPDDRESSRLRSRSRDRAWTRDFRNDRSRDREWDLGRNEAEDRLAKEDLDRELDRSRRDVTSLRPSSRNSNVSLTGPSTPHSASVPPSYQSNTERYASKPSTPIVEAVRRPVANTAMPSVDYFSRDDTRKNPHILRKDPIQSSYAPHPTSSPPQATQVPAFGSAIPRYTPTAPANQTSASNIQQPRSEAIPLAVSKSEKVDPTLLAPTAPKALVSQLPPTAPRAGVLERRSQLNALGSHSHGHIHSQDVRNPSQSVPPVVGSPSAFRSNGITRPGANNRFLHASFATVTHPVRNLDQRLGGSTTPRSNQLDPTPIPEQSAPKPHSQFNHANNFGKTPPRAPVAVTPSQTSPGAPPLGPRLAQGHAAIRPQVPPIHRPFSGHKTWINPKRNQQPSIMNPMPPTAVATVPAKRDYAGEARTAGTFLDQNAPSSDHTVAYRPHDVPKTEGSQLHSRVEDQTMDLPLTDISIKPASSTLTVSEDFEARSTSAFGWEIASQDQDDGETRGKLESVSDDEDGMDLDEGDLVEAEKKFNQDILALEAQRPATPRHHMELVMLLEEIDALAGAAEDLANGVVPQPVESDEKAVERNPIGLPSPKSEEIDDERMEVDNISDFQKDTIRDETPPVDNLPYLFSGPPTPFSEIQIVQENLEHHDLLKSRILDIISRQRETIMSEDEGLKDEYARLYKPWRQKVNELDQQKKFTTDSTLAPTSPVPITSPVVTPAPLLEGRRTGRFVSELELQRVIEESKIAAEAEEIREKEAQDSQALADLEKEAIIPDMLNKHDAVASLFKNTNHLIDTSMVFEVLSFAQAQDDFTAEEHKLFTENYMIYPKKWGHIAETIPGRDYQDCIMHYYLSKKDANYKVQLNRRIGKRGRKVTRGPQARPKSNALMSDMGKGVQIYESNEFDTPQLAVTDTGRPKRAAAPKFGDIGELDPTTAVPTPVRRGVGATKGEVMGELVVEKQPTRRARTSQPKEKGTKRGRAPLLAPSPQKKEIEVKKPEIKELKLEDGVREKEIEEAKLLASFHASQPNPPVLSPPKLGEGWLGVQQTPINQAPIGRLPSQPPPPVQKQQQQHSIQEQQDPPKQQQGQSRSGSQTSSYWSVPEQNDFINLLKYYGTDWQQIAIYLRNKTPVMVKNYYTREVEKGALNIETAAVEADDKIKRGVHMGNPPQPTLNQKRRYETTPQITQRTLAPSIESVDLENGSPALVSNTISQAPPLQMTQIPSRLAPLPQSTNPSAPALPQPISQKASISGNRNNIPIQQQRAPRSSQGPVMESFNDREIRPILQAQPITPRQQPQHQQRGHEQQQQSQQQQHAQQRHVLEQHDFQEVPARQRTERQEQETYPISPQTAPIQKSQMSENPQTMQSRGGPSAPQEIERRPQGGVLQSPINPSPPAPHRPDSFGQISYGEMSFQSPASSRVSILSPPQDPVRPNSVPLSAFAQPPPSLPPPPRPTPAPVKRSNIMSILNDEPAEPQTRKTMSESRIAAPTPPPPSQSPAISIPPYQPSNQPPQHLQRRDHQIELNHPIQQHQRGPISQLPPSIQPQQEQPQQDHPLQPREPMNTWSTPMQQRPMYEQRQVFSSQAVNSPRQQPMYSQPSSRPLLQHHQPARAPSPPPPTHSRSVSYSNIHPHHPQPQSIHPPAQAALHRSPYSQMPHQQPSQIQPHPHAAPQPRPQPLFQHPHHHEAISRHDPLRQQDTIRQQEYTERQQHDVMVQQMLQQQQQQQQNQERYRRDVGRDPGRTYTPPEYRGAYGGAQGQGTQGRGYEDMR